MQPAFFSLILTAVLHECVPVKCRPRPQDPEQLPGRQQGSSITGTQADTPAGTGRFYPEPNGSMRRGVHRNFLVILPVRTATSNFVSIFDLRRKRFVCMDMKGELYNSRKRDREDCLFQRLWLDLANHREVFYSTSGSRLLRLGGGELRVVQREPPERSPALPERLTSPSGKRQRRSEEVNPSDPLRSESHPSLSGKDQKDADHGQPEQDKAGAVSKETISSCDDPLRVLQSNGPVSPVKTNIADRVQHD
ncbi:fibroblast growth factor 23-like [Brachyistius frenatus]|uniref:fibroblast growth factor 23-like n=1 Tax=Brachyistius frenatus TaxID=100188 RepID=UPI0037E78BA1